MQIIYLFILAIVRTSLWLNPFWSLPQVDLQWWNFSHKIRAASRYSKRRHRRLPCGLSLSRLQPNVWRSDGSSGHHLPQAQVFLFHRREDESGSTQEESRGPSLEHCRTFEWGYEGGEPWGDRNYQCEWGDGGGERRRAGLGNGILFIKGWLKVFRLAYLNINLRWHNLEETYSSTIISHWKVLSCSFCDTRWVLVCRVTRLS